MSNYLSTNVNPKTGKKEKTEWLDDYFGRHKYGVRFADGEVYRPEDLEEKSLINRKFMPKKPKPKPRKPY